MASPRAMGGIDGGSPRRGKGPDGCIQSFSKRFGGRGANDGDGIRSDDSTYELPSLAPSSSCDSSSVTTEKSIMSVSPAKKRVPVGAGEDSPRIPLCINRDGSASAISCYGENEEMDINIDFSRSFVPPISPQKRSDAQIPKPVPTSPSKLFVPTSPAVRTSIASPAAARRRWLQSSPKKLPSPAVIRKPPIVPCNVTDIEPPPPISDSPARKSRKQASLMRDTSSGSYIDMPCPEPELMESTSPGAYADRMERTSSGGYADRHRPMPDLMEHRSSEAYADTHSSSSNKPYPTTKNPTGSRNYRRSKPHKSSDHRSNRTTNSSLSSSNHSSGSGCGSAQAQTSFDSFSMPDYDPRNMSSFHESYNFSAAAAGREQRSRPRPQHNMDLATVFSDDEEENGRATNHRPLVEIIPGYSVPLRGSRETWKAFCQNTVVSFACTVCGLQGYCIDTCSMVICPTCRNMFENTKRIPNAMESLGLGLTEDDIVKLSCE